MLDITPPPSPPIAVVKTMTADEAARQLLGDRPHAPIEHQDWHPDFEPVTVIDAWRLELVEKPAPVAGGCARQRWSIRFAYRFDAPVAARLPETPNAATEVAPLARGACRADLRYVHVNPGIAPAVALAALSRLDAIARDSTIVRFRCTDRTASGLCGGDAAIRRSLSMLPRWLVARDGAATRLLLGEGGVVTAVSWNDDQPDSVAVSREVPAPF